jgi:hypothetical protein
LNPPILYQEEATGVDPSLFGRKASIVHEIVNNCKAVVACEASEGGYEFVADPRSKSGLSSPSGTLKTFQQSILYRIFSPIIHPLEDA